LAAAVAAKGDDLTKPNDHEENKSEREMPDPFNPEALRLDQSLAENAGVVKRLMTVPVRKPAKQDFVRVHPGSEYMMTPVALIEIREDNETYLVTPSMVPELPGEFTLATLVLAINRQAVPFIWPLKLAGADGRDLEWYRSAREAADIGKTSWVRVTANKSLGAYEASVASGTLPEPVWPKVTWQEYLAIAFRDRLVNNTEHPLIQRLRGLT
jgi:hypothetical protein